MTSNVDEQSKKNGRWTKQEHEKFVLGLQLYGKDWKKIQALIGTRNGAQIRSHAQKFFIKVKKEGEIPQNTDHWEQTKESPPESANHINSLVQAFTQPETKPEYSYYLSKIVSSDALKESFDFWGLLIDHKPLTYFQVPVCERRKNSFVSIDEEKQDLEGCEPHKKVKCQ